jgi:hypothetical protein
MRFLAALIFALSVGTAQAAPNIDQLPAGAVGLVAFDIAAFRASKVGQAVEKLAGMKSKGLEASRKLSEQLGIDTKKDLQDLVVAIYPGPDGKVAEKNASGVVLIRGKFLPATIDSFGAKNGIVSRTVGKHKAWEASTFIEKLSGEKRKDNAKDAYIVAHSESLVIIASEEFLDRALAAADRQEQSAQLPAAVASKFAAAQQGWLYLYADATKMEKPVVVGVAVEDISLVLGENATDLQLAIAAGFATADKAATMRRQFTTFLALSMIGLSNDDGKPPEDKENMALLSELCRKIRIGGEGKSVTLDLDFPADKAVQAISKVIEKTQIAAGAPSTK